MTYPLMPTATAVWLIENTSLTFNQIANFCGIHKLEVEGIANDDVAHGIKGFDPITSKQLTFEEIEKCQKDSNLKLNLTTSSKEEFQKKKSNPRYTPISRRRDRPDAIAWLIRNHPEISDSQISKMIGTTKATILSIRNRTHWNSTSIKPVDPVSLGLCTQEILDKAVQLAANRMERREKEKQRALKRVKKQITLTTDTQENLSEQSIEQTEDLSHLTASPLSSETHLESTLDNIPLQLTTEDEQDDHG